MQILPRPIVLYSHGSGGISIQSDKLPSLDTLLTLGRIIWMATAGHNSANPLPKVFQIPDPVEEFGQDGGHFYHCYDAIAKEIDEDMTSGLKEQLE
ncbi:hypothetical protein FS837_010706 [Tulasnella sp. UAMH 9824]|nr:hypothetical protein FS837_010706 [Tulasnella sp. UAMH 9824]